MIAKYFHLSIIIYQCCLSVLRQTDELQTDENPIEGYNTSSLTIDGQEIVKRRRDRCSLIHQVYS